MRIPNDIWFKLPIGLRERWWRETDYGRREPPEELAETIRNAATAIGLDLPTPGDADN